MRAHCTMGNRTRGYDFPWYNAPIILSIDGNPPTPTNVESNSYIFWNIEHMYTKGPATGLAQAFINYMSTPDAQASAAQLQFLLIKSMSPAAIAAHQPS